MASDEGGEKSEEPTGKKLEKAFEEGNFAKSQEIGTLAILSVSFVIIAFHGQSNAQAVGDLAASIFSSLHDTEIAPNSIVSLMEGWVKAMVAILFPLIGTITCAAIAAGGLQSNFRLTPKALSLKLSKISPISGLQKLFNKKQFVQLGFDFLKFTLMGWILYGLVLRIMDDPIFSSPVNALYVGEFIWKIFLLMMSKLIMLMAVIALLDYMWQKYKTKEELKMTKQEVKDERKQSDGSPEVKAEQRRRGMRILQESMMKSVPTADVVVTNPTHFAVALKYEQGIDSAPVVLAKGTGRFARKLKTIARDHGVPMVEDKPVARILYKVGIVGQTIPLELYEVVARILSEVYKTHRYYFHRLKARRLEAQKQSR